MRTLLLLFPLWLSLTGTGCRQASEPAGPGDPPPPARIDSTAIILVEAFSDSLARDGVSIRDARTEQDSLRFTAYYNTGCAQHQFALFGLRHFNANDPPRLLALFSHNNGGELCRAQGVDSLSYSLLPVRQLYRQTFGRTSGTVRLQIVLPRRVASDTVTVDYHF